MSREISSFLSERIVAGDFPSAVYLVAEKGEIVLHEALGNAVVVPEIIPAKKDTIYDLASLTKVLVTGLLVARSLGSGQLVEDTPIRAFLPEFEGMGKDMVTVRHLISHTSGFAAWKPFYLRVDDPAEIALDIASFSFEYEPGTKVVYSDANFILLGLIVEAVEKMSLDQVFHDEIVNFLGLRHTGYSPSLEARRSIAACETGNMFERQTCVEAGYQVDSYAFRKNVIWGEVHDGNAHFMGGVAGHAGLFSTARNVFEIALQFLPSTTSLLFPEDCGRFSRLLTNGLNEHRSFAFQLATTPDSTAGTKMPPESFGHLGFTGTSLWIDPVKERIFILLTNRTHNHPLPFVNLNAVRRRFHDLAIDYLDKN